VILNHQIKSLSPLFLYYAQQNPVYLQLKKVTASWNSKNVQSVRVFPF
jgi:hypothetical protein